MKGGLVADAGPLIGLARIGQADLLRRLYGTVWIPPRVLSELRIGERRPGALILAKALEEAWLEVETLPEEAAAASLLAFLDPGEAEVILLAEQIEGRAVLLDDRRARGLARRRGLHVVGTGGVLLAAKREGLLGEVAPALEALSAAGYRLSAPLTKRLLEMAGESSSCP